MKLVLQFLWQTFHLRRASACNSQPQVLLHHLPVVMAPKVAGSKKFANTRSAKGAGKSQASADAKKLYAVDPSHAAVKWSIRPYLDKRGSPFFGDVSTNAFLSERHMMENVLTGGSSEWCNRLGYAMSLGGSTIQGGAQFVAQYCTPKDGESPANVEARAFHSFGLADLGRMLSEPDGAAFVKAMTYLNDDTDRDRTEEQVAVQVKRVLRFLKKDTDAKAACFRRVVNMSAKLYVLGMELLSETYLVNDVAAWQDKVRTTKTAQPPGVQKWLRSDADELSKLVHALVDSCSSQKLNKGAVVDGNLSEDEVPQPRDRKRRRRGASESDLGSDHSPPRNRRRGRGRSDSLASDAGRRRRRGAASVSPSAASRSAHGARGRKTDRRGDKDLASDSEDGAPARGPHRPVATTAAPLGARGRKTDRRGYNDLASDSEDGAPARGPNRPAAASAAALGARRLAAADGPKHKAPYGYMHVLLFWNNS